MNAPANTSIPSAEPVCSAAVNEREQRRALWSQALRQKSVWLRALKLGLTVGLLQATVNQGDHWWHGEVNTAVLAKSIVSPLIGFTLVLLSAAQTWVQRTLEQNT